MKTSFKVAAALGALVLAPAISQAALVSLNVNFGVLYKANGTTPLSLNSTLVLLADDDGDGFGSLTSPTSWSTDPGDVVVKRFGTNNFGDAGAGTFSDLLTGIPVIDVNTLTGLTPGRQLLLVWYDKPFNASDTGPGAGVSFGQFRTDAILPADGSDWNFIVPPSGTKTINFLTVANSGSVLPEAAGRATQVTQAVPEPATLGLALATGSLMLLRRRRVQA